MSAPRVLVTGGGRGIGRAIALRFAREGSRVVVAARTSSQLDDVAAECEKLGGAGLAANLNVADHGSIEAAIWRAQEFLGGSIEVLVNNAGVFNLKDFAKCKPADLSYQLDVNLSGAIMVTMEAMDYLEEAENPHVINIASVAAKQGFPGSAIYCATKYGLRGFSDGLREDCKEDGFRVTTVYPPATNTTIWDGIEGDFDESARIEPEVVADAVYDAWAAGASYPTDLDIPGK